MTRSTDILYCATRRETKPWMFPRCRKRTWEVLFRFPRQKGKAPGRDLERCTLSCRKLSRKKLWNGRWNVVECRSHAAQLRSCGKRSSNLRKPGHSLLLDRRLLAADVSGRKVVEERVLECANTDSRTERTSCGWINFSRDDATTEKTSPFYR